MAGRRVEREAGNPVRVTSTVVQLPRRRQVQRIHVARLAPSARSLLVTFGIATAAIGGYLVARDTSVFAVDTIEVDGASPAVALQVKHAVRGDLGTSLLRVDLDRVREEVAAVPTVARATLDRAFPHTLRIVVVPEQPVAVVRQGAASWLVSARGRIMAGLPHGARPRLPRIWVARGAPFAVGAMVPGGLHASLAAVAPLETMRFPARVASVRAETDELSLVLHSGMELRLGDVTDVRLKLAVAAKVLPLVAADTRYVDVSVPERPVAGSIYHAPDPPAAPTDATAGASASVAGSGTVGGDQTLKSKLEVDGAGSTSP
ncbi:MAG: FtsQ-type POTRA domain-containing protein [Actinobacteria bacterium]|nr:MAG: FtsQ-type POTRA domain-containing protein [Actinomycetota bacterium]